jgi:flagellar protein FliO/FliZ
VTGGGHTLRPRPGRRVGVSPAPQSADARALPRPHLQPPTPPHPAPPHPTPPHPTPPHPPPPPSAYPPVLEELAPQIRLQLAQAEDARRFALDAADNPLLQRWGGGRGAQGGKVGPSRAAAPLPVHADAPTLGPCLPPARHPVSSPPARPPPPPHHPNPSPPLLPPSTDAYAKRIAESLLQPAGAPVPLEEQVGPRRGRPQNRQPLHTPLPPRALPALKPHTPPPATAYRHPPPQPPTPNPHPHPGRSSSCLPSSTATPTACRPRRRARGWRARCSGCARSRRAR